MRYGDDFVDLPLEEMCHAFNDSLKGLVNEVRHTLHFVPRTAIRRKARLHTFMDGGRNILQRSKKLI